MTTTPQTADRCTVRRGFTLTELMVVTTLIGVMAAMSIPSFQRAVEQSRADIAAANLRAIWAAERLFWLENHAYTDKLSQQSPQPVGLMQLGLLDPSLPLTESAGTQSGEPISPNMRQEKSFAARGALVGRTAVKRVSRSLRAAGSPWAATTASSKW